MSLNIEDKRLYEHKSLQNITVQKYFSASLDRQHFQLFLRNILICFTQNVHLT